MKLESFIAFKYLIPRKKRLSSAIVSLFSMGVVSLVIWLSIVFVSVMHGLEQQWVQDLSRLHSPIKIIPTEAYYDSYYYQIDKYAEASQYGTKTIGEKLRSICADPYDPDTDFSLPDHFFPPDIAETGELRDLVKLTFSSLHSYLSKYQASLYEYEEGFGHIHMERSTEKKDLKSISQFLAYSSDDIYQKKVLPFDQNDYSTKILNTFNRSKEGWMEDFLRLQKEFRGASMILPISYKEMGFRIGDRGKIGVFSAEKEGEELYEFTVIGFYNPGLSPLGSKTVFIDSDLSARIRDVSEGVGMKNGWHVFFSDVSQIKFIQNQIKQILEELQLLKYWEVTSLYDYDFFKPILDQLQSDQVLFFFVSIIILLVACSNIVTMSVLLVNDKRKEIGILKAMGVSSRSLKFIFGLCGAISGTVGVIIGIFLAIITLNHLNTITHWISYLQGRDAFNPAFFGHNLPKECHIPFVCYLALGAICLAIISGIIPAKKIAKMSVTDILKSD